MSKDYKPKKKGAEKKTERDNVVAINKEIKANIIMKLYIFTGEDTFRRDLFVKNIKEKIPDGGFSEMNHIEIEGNAEFSDYDDAFDAFPMSVERKLIVIKNSGIFTRKPRGKAAAETEDDTESSENSGDTKNIISEEEDSAAYEAFVEYWKQRLGNIPEDTVVVFNEDNVNKSLKLGRFAKSIKNVRIADFDYLEGSDLGAWVDRAFHKRNIMINAATVSFLVDYCGNDLYVLSSEIQKLCDACDGKVTKSDILRVASKSAEVRLFDLTNAIGDNHPDAAISILNDIRASGESAFKLMYTLDTLFENFLKAKVFNGAAGGRINPYAAKMALMHSRAFSVDTLVKILERFPEMEYDIKCGKVTEELAIETFILECTHLASAGKK